MAVTGRIGAMAARASTLRLPRSGATPEARRRFDELSRRLLNRADEIPSARIRAGSASAPGPRLFSGDTVEECLRVRRVTTNHGDVLVRDVERLLPRPVLHGVRNAGPFAPAASDVLLVDLETAGLANAPIVLAGCAEIRHGSVHLRQLLAEDYAAEEALLLLLAAEMSSHPVTVTFNGTSFDLPMIRTRSALYHQPAHHPWQHVDLLSLARRTYRNTFANNRLATLEHMILGCARTGDLPSREVPAMLHRFLRHGEPADVAPVIHHNEVDLVSMAGLAVALGAVRDESVPPPSAHPHESRAAASEAKSSEVLSMSA
jgi:uncharacterized protein YprB with RNaseH-like and TPR domain